MTPPISEDLTTDSTRYLKEVTLLVPTSFHNKFFMDYIDT